MQREKIIPEYFKIEDLPIGLSKQKQQLIGELHDHEYTEIVIITSGSGYQLYNGVTLPVSTGEVYVIPKGCAHAWEKVENLSLVNVMVSSFESIELLQELQAHPAFSSFFKLEPNLRNQQKGGGRLTLTSESLNEVVRVLERLELALQKQSSHSATLATIQLLNLIHIFCDAYLNSSGKNYKMTLRIDKAICYLQSNWKEEPSVQELSEMIHVSASTFYRLFRSATGLTPIQYVNAIRIEHACELLKQSDLNISEIASELGFSESNYFARTFRSIKKMSPRAYRHLEPEHS
jgi:AraC-like DNA-binding protein